MLDWVSKALSRAMAHAMSKAPEIEHGKIFINAEISVSNGECGGLKTKVTQEQTHRPPRHK